MRSWATHAFFQRETLITGVLSNSTPLRIGAGQDSALGSLVDLMVLRIPRKGGEFPYIPGSSLKGVFRSFAFMFANKKGLLVCSGVGKTCERKKDETLEDFQRKACLLCKVFGAQGYRALATFYDAYPWDEKGEVYPFRFGARANIRVGRKTGSVGEGPFAVEYVEPGAKFSFSVKCINLPNYALGLLSSVLLFFREGKVKVGGFKTKGFGEIKVERLEFKTRDLPQEGMRMRALDEKDREIELSEAEEREGWIVAFDEKAWGSLKKLAEVWDNWSWK